MLTDHGLITGNRDWERRGEGWNVHVLYNKNLLLSLLLPLSVYGDNKTVSINIKWSFSGMLLLSVEQDSVARIWRMKVRGYREGRRTF